MAVNKKRLVKSGLWQMANTMIIIVSQIGANALIARKVSPEEYGIMAIVNGFINFASIISEAGMGDALMQRKEVEPGHKNAALYFSLLISTVLFLLLYFTAPWISGFYDSPEVNGEPVLIPALRVMGLGFIILALASSSFNLMMKEFKFKQVFISDSLTLLASNVLGVILAFNGYGIWSLVYSILFYKITRLVLLWYFEPIPVLKGAKLQHWKDIFSYGAGLTLVRFYNYISGFGIMLQVGKLVPLSATGLFERSYRNTNLPVRYIGDMIQKVMLPFMVKINDQEDKLYAFFYRGLAFSNTLLLPISVFSIVFCKPIVLILLGHKWLNAVLPMQILFLSLPFRISTKVSDILMRVKNLVFKNANRKLQYIIVLVAGIFVGSYWGLTGISVAVTLAAVFNYVFMLISVRRHVFRKGWRRLMLLPFKDGLMLSVITVLPSWGIYWVLQYFIKDEVVSFLILCVVSGVIFGGIFLKKPTLLGKDFAELQRQLKKLIRNRGKGGGKGKGKRRRRLEQAEGNGQGEDSATPMINPE